MAKKEVNVDQAEPTDEPTGGILNSDRIKKGTLRHKHSLLTKLVNRAKLSLELVLEQIELDNRPEVIRYMHDYLKDLKLANQAGLLCHEKCEELIQNWDPDREAWGAWKESDVQLELDFDNKIS